METKLNEIQLKKIMGSRYCRIRKNAKCIKWDTYKFCQQLAAIIREIKYKDNFYIKSHYGKKDADLTLIAKGHNFYFRKLNKIPKFYRTIGEI